MPVKGADNVKQRIRQFTTERQQLAAKAANIIGFTIGSRADNYVPVDTKALMNSRYVQVDPIPDGARVRVGYTQAYAAFLHNSLDWKPKPPGTPGKPTGGFNPEATPFWLNKGADETKQVQLNIIKDIFKV